MHISFYKRPLFLLLVVYALYLAIFLKIPSAKQGDISFYADGKAHLLQGTVINFPAAKEKEKNFILKVSSVDGSAASGLLYTTCKDACQDIMRGQKIEVKATLFTPQEQKNYGDFDWAAHLARRHIFCQSTVKTVQEIQGHSRFWLAISSVRNSILKVFNDNFGPQLSPVLSGITIGERGSIDKQLNAAFQDSGAMHLLVASGSNVGFVTLVVYFMCALFGLRRYTSAAAALSLALLYTLIAGADAPLVRAYIMTFASTAGFLLGRKSGVLQGFVIAALAILIVAPQSIFEAGFQMSFLAALSIIFLACNFSFDFKAPASLKFVLRIFFVSLAAQAALLPVFTNYFYKVSLSAVLSSILLVPLSGVIMAGGFIVWLLSFVPVHFIFAAAVAVLKEIVFIFTVIVQIFAGFSLSKITVSAWSSFSVAAYYIALLGLLNLPLIKRKILYSSVCLALAGGVLLCGLLRRQEGVYTLKGRYNYSVLIKEKDKVTVLGAGIDGKTLSRAVLASGSTQIDCLFLSGLSGSAAFGLKDIQNVKIKQIYLPYGAPAPQLAELLASADAPKTMLWAGQQACGVSAAEAWYINKEGQIFTPHNGDNVSFEYKGVRTSGSLKQVQYNQKMQDFKEDL